MAAALAESTRRSRRESDAPKTMTRIAERRLRRLRRVRAGNFRSEPVTLPIPGTEVRTKLDAFDAFDAHR